MPVLCDFEMIVGDSPVNIGDSNPVFERTFKTGGRKKNLPGFLIFNVRGMTHTTKDVVVSINGVDVGRIHNYRPGGAGIDTTNGKQAEKFRQMDHWYTQMIAFGGDQIRSGHNKIQIEAVDFPEETRRNEFDDFQIKDMFCFFRQAA